jgi:hypothetical protein
MVEREALAGWWREFAVKECRGYSPLYERISTAVADDADVLDLVRDAPLMALQPNLLLAAAHDLVLRGIEHPLTAIYAGESQDDPGPHFCDLVTSHPDEIRWYLAHRRNNTNECGRSAVLVPALRWVADHLGEPLVLLDGGTSAGLNLRLDQYRLDYGDAGTTGPADSRVRVECALSGDAPIREVAPTIAARVGLDRAPVDLEDEDEVRWLLACVWPDTGRLERTRAAIELARAAPVDVVEGDLVDDLATAAARLPSDLPLCVVTSWAVGYLPVPDRSRFAGALASLSHDRAVAWLSAEGRGVVDQFDVPEHEANDGTAPSVIGVVRYESGRQVAADLLGTCHPHGSSLTWTAITRR